MWATTVYVNLARSRFSVLQIRSDRSIDVITGTCLARSDSLLCGVPEKHRLKLVKQAPVL